MSLTASRLFRQSLEKADAYRQQRKKAGRRLFWTAGSTAGLVVLMASLTGGLAYYNQEKPRAELEVRLDAYRFGEPPSPAERLRLPQKELQRRLAHAGGDP